MNSFWRAIIAGLGAVNVVFNIFIPIAVGLMSVSYFPLSETLSNTVIIISFIATIYRAIDVGFMNMINK